jgi:hypothetical protein
MEVEEEGSEVDINTDNSDIEEEGARIKEGDSDTK